MEPLARLQGRIDSLHGLQDLLSAIKAMAATRVQLAQTALQSVTSYTEVIEHAISEAAAMQQPARHEKPSTAVPNASVLVILCSEHGFCGAFNRLLLERARGDLGRADMVAIVGQRGAALAGSHGITPAWTLPMATQIDAVLSTARGVAAKLEDQETVRVAFAKYHGGTSFEVEVRQVLPPRPELFKPRWEETAPLHHLRPQRLIHTLINELLLAELLLALTNSFASENAARLQIMQAANHNIEDKLAHLTQTSRRLRQEAITSEILEIVTGSEAVARAAAPNSAV